MNIFITRLKVLLRQKGNLFWTIVFPLGMALFFYMGFGNVDWDQPMDTIEIAVVEENDYKLDDAFSSIIKDIKIDDDKNLFSITMISSLEEAKQQYNDTKIDNYMFKDTKYQFVTRFADTTSTIVDNLFMQYETFSVYANAAYENGETLDYHELWEKYNTSINTSFLDNVQGKSYSESNAVYFYALIAMMCLYASFWGIGLVSDIRADSSMIGQRAGIAPTSKLKTLGLYFLAALLIQMVSTILLIVVIRFPMGVQLDSLGLVFLAAFIGDIGGIALGACLATFIKGSKDKKENFANAIVLILCFFAGLMSSYMKYIVDKSLGMLSKLNIADAISDSMFSLSFYPTYKEYAIDLGFIGGISIVLMIITFLRMRGKKYASL